MTGHLTQGTTTLLCTFTLADLSLGVPVQDVQEVLRYREMTEVPRAPAGVSGLINLRGEIVTAIDLRHLFGVGPRDAESLPMNLVLHRRFGRVSLLVDAIRDVVEAHSTEFEQRPGTVTGTGHDLIKGVYKLDGELLLLLDTCRAMDVRRPDMTLNDYQEPQP